MTAYANFKRMRKREEPRSSGKRGHSPLGSTSFASTVRLYQGYTSLSSSFVVVNIPFLAIPKNWLLVTGPADGVPVQGKEFQGFHGFPLFFVESRLPRHGIDPLRSVPCIIPNPFSLLIAPDHAERESEW